MVYFIFLGGASHVVLRIVVWQFCQSHQCRQNLVPYDSCLIYGSFCFTDTTNHDLPLIEVLKEMECPICQELFTSEFSIDRHIEKVHQRKTPPGPGSSKKVLSPNSMLMFNGVQKGKKKIRGKENKIDFNM